MYRSEIMYRSEEIIRKKTVPVEDDMINNGI